MGPRQFHKEFIGREEYDKRKGKCLHNLANIEGKLGVDVSGTFHKKLGTVRGASSFDMTPEVPLFEAVNSVMKDCSLFASEETVRSLSSLTGSRIP